MGRKKFWTFNVLDNTNFELLLYGDISERSWWGDEITPQQFNQDLARCANNDLIVRINSGGGDVFAAHAIYNSLVNYPGNVTVKIEGLCASAATIIASAGNTVIMPNNALFMIHDPMVYLDNVFDAAELKNMSEYLAKVKDTICNVYLKRTTSLTKDDIAKLMTSETWLTAEEAKSYGFIDVIDGMTIESPTINKGMVVVNNVSCKFSTKNKLKLETIVNKERNSTVNEQTLINKIAALLGISVDDGDTQNVSNVEDTVNEATVERERMLELDKLKTGNKAVNAIVETAKLNGFTVDMVKPFIDSVAKANNEQTVVVNTPNKAALDEITKMIKDQLNSGAKGIKPMTGNKSTAEADKKQREIDNVVNYANQKGGRK